MTKRHEALSYRHEGGQTMPLPIIRHERIVSHGVTETRRHGEEEMYENKIGGIVFDCAVKIHMRLGPGLLDYVDKALQFCDSGEAPMKDGISRFINGKME